MTTPTRLPRARRAGPPTPPDGPPEPVARSPRATDPDGGSGDLHELLTAAVEEAARLLEADGAMVYLVDPSTGHLRFAHDAGIRSRRSRTWVRSIDLPVGVGMFGRAVAERAVVVTRDYLDDTAFAHAPDTDRVVQDIGLRSMVVAPLVAGDTVFGALGTFSSKPDAFSRSDIGLVRALADHAAASMANARLIEAHARLIDELATSREALARTADAERTLREIAGRVSATHDQGEILQAVIDAAVRLLGASGAVIDLAGRAGTADTWTSRETGDRGLVNMRFLEGVPLDPDAGVSGLAISTRQVAWTGDYLADGRFGHTPERDRFVREGGIRSVIAAPLVHHDVIVGAITVYGDRPDAFDDAGAELLAALADQAAVAIANASLIGELERSRAEVARRADSEQTLREIAARVSAILEPAEVLQQIVDESTRLLESDGARIDIYDPELDALIWSYAAGDAMSVVPDWGLNGGLKPGQAVAGTAFAEQRPARTDDYLVDDRFSRDDTARAFVKQSGIRSVIAVPLAGGDEPLGTLSVVSRRPAAYDEADGEVLTALATQASIAIRNARLIEELASSRAVIERRAEAERALREIATRITAIREPGDLLQRIVDEARRLLRADGAVIDEYDSERDVLISVYDAGLTDEQRASVRTTRLHLGEGLSGKAMAERRVIAAGDYLAGEFMHIDSTDEMARSTGIGDLIVAPIIGDEGPLGAIEVYQHERHAFDEIDAEVLGGLADQAAIAITNARLIEELERSQATVAKRADTERALREITARIAALREPEIILHRVVEEARRLLGTDGAHLTRMSEDRTYLVPVVVTGATDADTQAWLLDMKFQLGGGINGLAAERGEAVWTEQYSADPRIPHEGNDDEVADRLGLCGMAAAPLRAPGGDVIGTLAISTAKPRRFDAEELDLLQGLADQAAIAITNSTLLTRLRDSELRYRFLVENSPDVVFSIDAEGTFTYLSESMERMSGWTPEEVTGGHFSRVVEVASQPEAARRWAALEADPLTEQVAHINLQSPDGRLVPVEVSAIGMVDAAGAFSGIHGATRDISERARLERELRESEERYRYLVASSPDLVWLTDASGNLTFVSDAARTMLGYEPAELIGLPYAEIFAPSARRDAQVRFRWLASHPSAVHRMRLPIHHADGHDVMVEINGTGMTDDGRFIGAHGAARDVSERDRLERDLRRQAGELAAGEERAHLARELHDSVTQALFSMTLVSRSVELLLDRDGEAARVQLGQLRDLQREALAEMRALIFELRPGNLEQDGLSRALRTHTAALQGRIGLPVVVESTLDERLPLPIEEVLYRISQEALHNVVKHAGARHVRLEVGRIASGVRLRVHDDGKGFDPARVPDGHLGLAGMRARADKVGARFWVKSVPGEGTTIEVIVPEAALVSGGTPAGVIEAPSIRDG